MNAVSRLGQIPEEFGKTPVRVESTGPLTLSGLQTVNGVALNTGDRVLVKDQVTLSENGIYVVQGTDPWIRANDLNQPEDAYSGVAILSQQTGSFYYISIPPGTYWNPDSTDMTFAALDLFPEAPIDGNAYARQDGGWVLSPPPVWGNITGTLSAQTDLQTALDAKTDNSVFNVHGHPISAVTGLQAELDLKANLAGAIFTGDVDIYNMRFREVGNDVYLLNEVNGGRFLFRTADGTGTVKSGLQIGGTTPDTVLFHDGNVRFTTTNEGARIGTIDNATIGLYRGSTTGALFLSGGSGQLVGAHIDLFGPSAVGLRGNDMDFGAGTDIWMSYDDSADSLTLDVTNFVISSGQIDFDTSGYIGGGGQLVIQNDSGNMAIQQRVNAGTINIGADNSGGSFNNIFTLAAASSQWKVNNTTVIDIDGSSLDFLPGGTVGWGSLTTLSAKFGNYTFNTDQTVGAGQNGYALIYNDTSGEIELQALGGGGNVSNTGTPALGQIAIWNGTTVIKGDANFLFDSGAIGGTQFTVQANAGLAGGNVALFSSDLAAKTGQVVRVLQNNASSTADALSVSSNGTGNAIDVTVGTTTAKAARFYSNVATRSNPLVEIIQDSATGGANATALRLQQDDGAWAQIIDLQQFDSKGIQINNPATGAGSSAVMLELNRTNSTGGGSILNISQLGTSNEQAIDITTADGTTNGNGRILVNGISVDPVAAVKKATATNRSNTTALADDPDLSFYALAGSVYEVTMLLKWGNQAGGGGVDVRWNLTALSGCTFIGEANYVRFGSGTGAAFRRIVFGNTAIQYFTKNATTPTVEESVTAGSVNIIQELFATATYPTYVKFIYQTGATAGRVYLRWAQAVSNANATTLNADSCLIARKIDPD